MSKYFKTSLLFWKPVLWLAIITVMCLMPPQNLPGKSLWRIPHFDKMVHFGMYFILAVLMVRPLRMVQLRIWMTTIITSVVVGGLIEILQFAVTSMRSANWGDFGADVAGAIIGLVSYRFLIKGQVYERYI